MKHISLEEFSESSVGMLTAPGYGEYFYCVICGFRMEMPPDDQPIAYTCPICGMGYIRRRGG